MTTYDDYYEYLESPEWQTMRQLRLAMDGYQCRLCHTAKNLNVHHIRYPTEYGTESLNDLVTLCDRCHKSVVHYYENCADDFRKAYREDFYEAHRALRLGLAIVKDYRFDDLNAKTVIHTLNRGNIVQGFKKELTNSEIAIKTKNDEEIVRKLEREIGAAMQKRNWQRPSTIGDSTFERLAPGGYVARIISAEDHDDRQYFELVYDIAEGPKAGFYSDSWGLSHPNAHRIIMSYKDTALNMLEGRLNAFDASNPGFDSRAVCDAERFEMFIGRLIGINLQEEEYLKNDNTIGIRLNVCQVTTAQDVRDGKVKVRDKKPLKDEDRAKVKSSEPAPQTMTTAMRTDDIEIPF